jgi:broad specificity phosphatase PhoE
MGSQQGLISLVSRQMRDRIATDARQACLTGEGRTFVMQRRGHVNTLYFVRHGENRANLTREFSHRKIDYPLTERGIEQARQTAGYFRDKRITAVYASPLRRAAQTAQILAAPLGLDVTLVEEFREINVGDLEGQPPSDANWALHDQIYEDWFAGRAEARFPGGEDHPTLLARMATGLREVTRGRSGEWLVVVAHGGILVATVNALCANFRVESIADARGAARVPNCAITEFAIETPSDPDALPRLMLRHWASCEHLEPTLPA